MTLQKLVQEQDEILDKFYYKRKKIYKNDLLRLREIRVEIKTIKNNYLKRKGQTYGPSK